jgi:four helix bundle protein
MSFRFESLNIWHGAREYSKQVHLLSAKFPRSEEFSLRSQINRAANSISLNIAEGSAKSDKSFGAYLDTSIGSTYEVVGCSFLALDRGYITEVEHKTIYMMGEQLAKSIRAFRNTLK